MAEWGRVWQSGAEYGRVWQSMAEYGSTMAEWGRVWQRMCGMEGPMLLASLQAETSTV